MRHREQVSYTRKKVPDSLPTGVKSTWLVMESTPVKRCQPSHKIAHPWMTAALLWAASSAGPGGDGQLRTDLSNGGLYLRATLHYNWWIFKKSFP